MEPDLAARSFSLARLIVIRSPTTFGPKLTPPPGADKQARLLSFPPQRAQDMVAA
ncbi:MULTISPECIES: hypothetical protein [Nocardiaceae]|uniref:hypothetical protein n=1 Tax=Nocardiaceae TaxID=85025 RepID=UPI000B16EC19|nr:MULTISPECIES: hypothetical protein [Rhodococcus]